MEPYTRAEWGGKVIFNSYSPNACGVCILFSNDFEYKIHKIKRDIDGNSLYIFLDLEIKGKRVLLINLYGLNAFYVTVAEVIEEFNNDTFIICVDFNLVQDQELDN